MKNTLIFVVAITLAGVSGFALQRYLATNTANTIDTAANIIRPEFALKDLDGKLRDIREWDGKIVIINFWATWCSPCMKEIPELIELQNRYGSQGLQIIGIAIDKEKAVREYMNKTKINYPIMVNEQAAMQLSSQYGNHIGGLPFTAIINREGLIIKTITGILDLPRAEKILSALGIET